MQDVWQRFTTHNPTLVVIIRITGCPAEATDQILIEDWHNNGIHPPGPYGYFPILFEIMTLVVPMDSHFRAIIRHVLLQSWQSAESCNEALGRGKGFLLKLSEPLVV